MCRTQRNIHPIAPLVWSGITAWLLLTAGLAAETQPAEVTTREETPTFQSSVSLVRVPVVVRDKQGHPVGGLHKADFQIADRGKPQYVSQFAVEGGAVAKPAAKSTQHEMAAELTGEAPKLVAPTRFVAYAFDDLHLKTEELLYARVAALKHIEHGIPPEERIALLTLSGRVALEFTDDAAKFRATLMKVVPVPPSSQTFPPVRRYMAEQFVAGQEGVLALQTKVVSDCLNLPASTAQSMARDALNQAGNQATAEDNNAFRVLNAMVRAMSSMPGGRVLILVSPGMYVPDEYQRNLDESTDRATRAGVVVNTLDARGVYANDSTGEVSGCGTLSPQTTMAIAESDRKEAVVDGTILRNLAYDTGGTYAAQNDFAAEFGRLALPPEYVYYLGYYPQDLKPDGRFHEIKVTLPNGKGLTVTARKGYWAPSHEENAAATATREIAEAVFSRDEMRELAVDLHTQFYKTSPEDAKATVASHLDFGRLPLRKQDGRNRDDVTVVCALFDRNGNFLQGRQTVVEIRLKDGNVESRRAQGVTVNHEFDLKSGGYLVRVVARDAEGRQMAAVNGVVEIP